jgi:hypothetical protein
MERDEAKAILELCRPGIEDDRHDPLIAEAWAVMESDAEIQAWFAEQQAVDARISESYQTLEAPSELKASILAGMRAHAMQSANETTARVDQAERGVSTTSQAWWRKPSIGIAALFAILFVIVILPENNRAQEALTGQEALEAGIPDMIQFLAQEIKNLSSRGGFDKASNDAEALKTYLAGIGTPSPSTLPGALQDNRPMGCFTFDYDGTKIGMICFQAEQMVHLITIRKSDCPRSFRPLEPMVYEFEGQAFKAWSDRDLVYILSTEGSKEKLPELI